MTMCFHHFYLQNTFFFTFFSFDEKLKWIIPLVNGYKLGKEICFFKTFGNADVMALTNQLWMTFSCAPIVPSYNSRGKGEREKNRFKLRPQLWRHCLSKKSPFWLLLLLLLLKVWAEIVGQFRIEKENKIFEKISRANYFKNVSMDGWTPGWVRRKKKKWISRFPSFSLRCCLIRTRNRLTNVGEWSRCIVLCFSGIEKKWERERDPILYLRESASRTDNYDFGREKNFLFYL